MNTAAFKYAGLAAFSLFTFAANTPATAQDAYPNRPIRLGGSPPESSTQRQLGQVLAQTVDEGAATIQEYGMQQQ